MIEKVAFTLYPVENLERARKFYENVLTIKVSKLSGGGRWVEYDLPGGGCFCISDIPQGMKPSSDFGGSVAFEVSDLAATLKELKAKGVKVKVDAFQTPVCQIAIILDSEGNAVSLHQLHKK